MAEEETLVRILPWQEMPASDLMAMQEDPQASVDAIVREALGVAEAYTGLTVISPGATDILVGTGRYWKDGRRYKLHTQQTLSLLAHLPTLGLRRMVSVAVVGAEIETDQANRRFLEDSTPGSTNFVPKPTDTRRKRVVQIELVAGLMATAALPPNVPPGYLEIARVELTETGVVGAPQMQTEKLLRSMAQGFAQLDAIADLMEEFEGQLASLRSDLAAVIALLATKPDRDMFVALSRAVARLNEHVGVPDNNILAGFDRFESESESDVAHPDYDAHVDHGGVQFPREAAVNVPLALLNPADPRVSVSPGGVCLPAHTDVTRLKVVKRTHSIRPLDGAQANWTIKSSKLGRTYMYYGGGQNREEVEADIESSQAVRLFDPVANAYETVDLSAQEWKIRSAFESKDFTRVKTTDPYPAYQQATTVLAGAAIAQTWLNGRLGWLKRWDIAVLEKGSSGPIHSVICRTKPNGEPDLERAKVVATVAHADIKVWPELTPIFYEPTVLRPGNRFAQLLITTGGHVLATSSEQRRMKGSLLAANNGAAFDPVQGRDLLGQVYFAEFADARTVVELSALQLAGGIQDIDFFGQGYEPDGSDLVFKVMIGGVWRNVDRTDLTALAGAPNLIPMQIVFKGTPEAMPGLNLNGSRIVGWRPKTAMTHISTARTLPGGGSDEIELKYRMRDFDAEKHTADLSLLHGVDHATETAATATVVEDTPDPRFKVIRGSFALGAPITSYKRKIHGTAEVANDAFSLARVADTAL